MSGGKDGKEPAARPDPESAFDLWLKRGLHQLFDSVANEPVPEELLRLIDEDREGKEEGET
ncbi:NepR family anti-sigma factor [Acidomonas methanolica]|uniref:Anti-sigma factor NepR domain-containing protein n=1 Tax=Acidomonas methanolica NBRC 104435 TaxID=1231351 RepID=A0A023D1N2_ACIMT|nr:NepR family anti-sigma factor [Acidomonas methanolica]MBU2652879.1 hypothetical protein [Acidomonas methanolica]TCS31283.1 hypothetical protein EDC31_103126 [Acidomonas methanolica]GAJ27994.1 hypothetical protein Amme_011_094 [Acidomonas methanolica NBRC 104435]GBQ53458.1 hypothetical protein AA0498_1945 [Acidomonas methanolica]GEK98469.1 hypothetical protein AME01nite_09680 [Acidomonas methanolica NBRC 104435]